MMPVLDRRAARTALILGTCALLALIFGLVSCSISGDVKTKVAPSGHRVAAATWWPVDMLDA